MPVHPTTTIPLPAGPAAEPSAHLSTRPTLRGAALGTATALVATSALYAVGNVGTDITVVTGWAPDGAPLRDGEVLATVVVAVLAGAGLLALLERRSRAALGPWSAVAAAVAVLSALPLWRLEVDTGSRLWLTAMHLATGACAIAAQRATHPRP